MFGIWKYDPETDEMQNIRKAWDPITARSRQHQACNRCHEKKVKCSGDKKGCDRCAASRTTCDYSRLRSRASRRRKTSGQTSPEPTAAAASTSSRASREGTNSHSSQFSSSYTATAAAGAAAAPCPGTRTSPPCPGEIGGVSRSPHAASHHAHSSALSQLDLAALQPEDSFYMSPIGANALGVDYAASTGSDYAATTSPEYTVVSAAYYPPQPAYADLYDRCFPSQYSLNYPSICAALDLSYMAATTHADFSGLTADSYQDHGEFAYYHHPDPRGEYRLSA